MEKPMNLITEVTESIDDSRDSRPAIASSERALNGAILAAEISESCEEYLEIFDHFYADDIHATAEGLKEPVEGKAAVRARRAGFLVPLHVFAEIGGVSVSLQWSQLASNPSVSRIRLANGRMTWDGNGSRHTLKLLAVSIVAH